MTDIVKLLEEMLDINVTTGNLDEDDERLLNETIVYINKLRSDLKTCSDIISNANF